MSKAIITVVYDKEIGAKVVKIDNSGGAEPVSAYLFEAMNQVNRSADITIKCRRDKDDVWQ